MNINNNILYNAIQILFQLEGGGQKFDHIKCPPSQTKLHSYICHINEQGTGLLKNILN